MNFDEFANIFKQLGLKVSHARIIQLFSQADEEKRGELNFYSFKKAMEKMKFILIQEIMDELGISVLDMAIAFAFSIGILILMLVFIFVGIGAFSPQTAFSSVTNSALPLGAGAAVNKDGGKGSDKGEKSESKQKAAKAIK